MQVYFKIRFAGNGENIEVIGIRPYHEFENGTRKELFP